jgi:hypothetical protein
MSENVQQDIMNKLINMNLKNIPVTSATGSVNDVQHQNAINDALVKSGLPENKINGLISMVKDRLLCDSACQKQQTANKLKKIWDDSENNLKTAPTQVEIAEKNYYVYDKGYPKYQDLLFDRYSKTAEEMKSASIEKHKEYVNQVDLRIKIYDTGRTYLTRMYELLELKLEENKKLKNDIDHFIGTVQTNERKVDYSTIETTWISRIRTFELFIYYTLIVIYFLTSDFFAVERYKSKKTWFLIVLYLVFPYFLNWIVIQLYYLKKYIIHLFTTRPYKNAYENI